MTLSSETNFYTGKPNVRNLGYVFLMRNYRSDLSKWQAADPTGYPDGWNNFAYCNNQSTMGVDLYGAILIYTENIKNQISTLKETEIGNKVITALEESSNTHTIIELSKGEGSCVNAENLNNATNGIGSDSTITMDVSCTNNTSPLGSGWERPYELGIMHELIHSYQMDSGSLNNTDEKNGILISELEGCILTNKALEELKVLYPDLCIIYEARTTYGGIKITE